MSDPVLDLNGIKSLFAKGVHYAKEHFPKGLFKRADHMCDYQLSLANKAQDLNTLMGSVSLHNSVLSSAYKGQKPVCDGCEIQYTPIQFGVGNNGWYFGFGIAGDLCFTFGLNRQEIAPPQVVAEQGIEPSEAVRWEMGGGFGKVGGSWYNFPTESFYMKYSQPDYSTFSLVSGGQGPDAKFKSVALGTARADPTLSNTNPFQFTLNTTFISPTDNKEHTLNVKMIANTPATPNVPKSGGRSNNTGSLYYSFTDMDIIAKLDAEDSKVGKGWVDHQLFKIGIPRNIMDQAKVSVVNILSKIVTGGWLWFCVQDHETDTQYMFVHFFVDEFYKDYIRLGKKIDPHAINVYQKGKVHYFPSRTDMDSSDTEIRLTKLINVNGYDLPAEYDIILPGGKPVILTLASGPNQYPNPYASYENPALLYNAADTGKTKPIGIGIIEANGYMTNDEYAPRYISAAGGDVTDRRALKMVANMLSPNFSQSGGQKFLAFLIVLIPLWLLIITIVFILYKKNGRHPRVMIAITLLLVLYAITYQGKSNDD